MQQKTIFIASIFASLILLSSAALGDIYVRPAKLGIIRLTTQPLFPTVYQGTFDVGDTYNFSLNVSLTPTQNISSIFTLSDTNFTLQPNETKTVSFTIKPNNVGVYQGAVYINFSEYGHLTTVTYENDIVIIVAESNSYVLVLFAVAAVAIIVAISGFVMYNKRGKGKK